MPVTVAKPAYRFDPPGLDQYAPYFCFKEQFTPPECQAIQDLATKYTAQQATISVERTVDPSVRRTTVRWIPLLQEDPWLATKLGAIVERSNAYYHFELAGFLEHLQYTEYRELDDYYDWHMDFGDKYLSKRKLSISVQLSSPDAYEGCELELCAGRQTIAAPKERGTVIVFPSFILHRVTPLTRGERHALVVWVGGSRPFQ
jgi:PKHD-type hydroxylase